MAFYTRAGATDPIERMRITSAGNVSIGNTNNTYKLDVTGQIKSTQYLIAPDGTNNVYHLVDATSTYAGLYTIQAGGGSSGFGGSISMYGHSHATKPGYVTIGISASSNGKFTVTDQANASGTEIFVVQQNGNVGIGTTSPSEKLHVAGAIAATGTATTAIPSSSTMDYFSATTRFISRGTNNSTRGAYRFILEAANGSLGIDGLAITTSGILTSLPTYDNTTGVAANVQIDSNGFFARSTSSLKYKKDIRNYDKGLDLINLLRPVYYKGKSESDGDKQFAGLIAEEVHDLGLTEFVQYAPDGSPDAISYQNMIALAFKAIQELKAENDTLKSRIDTLEQA